MSIYDPLCLRSRTLLRDTLLKDDLNRSTASLPLPNTMSVLASPPSTPLRRGLSPSPRSEHSPSRPRHHHKHSASVSYSSPVRPKTARLPASDFYSPPAPLPRRPHTAHPTRDHSRSPLTTTTHPPETHSHLITPHEQVLRARLERVLHSAGVPDNTERGRGRTPSATSTILDSNARPHKRNRSNTESNIPLHLAAATPKHLAPPRTPHAQNPSRSASLVRQKKLPSTRTSTGSGSASRSGSGSGKRSATRTTPPLVPDDEEHYEAEATSLLLTPPSTPSPPGFGLFQISDWGYKARCYNTRQEEDEEDADDDDESCSSSYSSYRGGSSIASSALHSSLARHPQYSQQHTPLSPSPQARVPPQSPHTPMRSFNARRASAQCRAIEGYVSFANVEGLGVPPDDPTSPHSPSQERAAGGKAVLMALGWGGGVVKKILGGGSGEKQGEEGTAVY